jgi:hypothetical protein
MTLGYKKETVVPDLVSLSTIWHIIWQTKQFRVVTKSGVSATPMPQVTIVSTNSLRIQKARAHATWLFSVR